MNTTVALVQAWGAFEERHPAGSIEDFCRHYLATHKVAQEQGPLVGGVVPGIKEGLLMKLIGRISKLNMAFGNLALRHTDLNQIEEFGLLMTIRQEKNPRKTDVIYSNLFELSSGTDMLNRLKKKGLIREYADKQDKRSKRLMLTAKGEKAVEAAFMRIYKNATMMTSGLSDQDKELCIQLLKNIEIKFSALWQQHKGRDFDEVYEEVMGKRVEQKGKKK
jgi:DNA-binding MarR family transcriptional regulator